MAGNLVGWLGLSGKNTLSVRGRATNRCHAPRTKLEKRLARVCSRLPEHRPMREVSWLASYLQRISDLQHVPPWKLERLGRNMAIAFIREGHDASAVCTDLDFSYFLVTGTLTSTAVGENRAPTSSLLTSTPVFTGVASPHHALAAERVAGAQARATLLPTEPELKENREAALPGEQGMQGTRREGGTPDPVDCGVENAGFPARACGAWADYPCDNAASRASSESAWSPPARMREGDWVEGIGSDVESKSLFSVGTATVSAAHQPPLASDAEETIASQAHGNERKNHCALTPGKSLDFYLQPRASREKRGLEGGPVELAGPGVVSGWARDWADGTTAAAWRLAAQEVSCIARVSRRLLRELEGEEQKHNVETKVGFLRKTEVFGDGFSPAALHRLAVLMEPRHEPEAAVVRRKGSAADTVVIVESGEAIRMGDPRADSMKNYSSLRVRAGQMFGAEEALSGLPGYTGNLMSLSPLKYFAVPVEAFLRATEGVSTDPLYQLRSKAQVVNHGCRPGSDRRLRPSTAQSVHFAVREAEEEAPLPTLLAQSETRLLPVTLTPVPLFSGPRAESNLEKRMKTMAAVWTPWAWASKDDEQDNREKRKHRRNNRQQEEGQPQHEQDPPPSPYVSRPQSAPASIPKRQPATTSVRHTMRRPDRNDVAASDDDDIGSPPLLPPAFGCFQEYNVKSSSTGDLMLRTDGGSGVAIQGVFNNRNVAAEVWKKKKGGRRRDAAGGGQWRGQAAPSSDFRRLRPSTASSNSLAGCSFNAVAAMTSLSAAPSVVAHKKNNSHESISFRSEAVEAKKGRKSSSPGRNDSRHRFHSRSKQERREAACDHSNDTGSTSDTNNPGFSFPARTGGTMGGGKDIGGGGGGGGGVGPLVVGPHGGYCDRGVARAGLSFSRRDRSRSTMLRASRRVPCLYPESPPSSPYSGDRLASTPPRRGEPCSKGELEEARQAVSSRPQRTRLCSAFRAHEPASAGMAAAQRAYRGAFVVNKMGDAKARSTWRP